MIQTTAGTTTGSSIRELSAVAVALSKYLHTYHRGRARAVKMDRLVQILGFNIRQIRDAVKELRESGTVGLCSELHEEPKGVWMGSEEEVENTIHSLEVRRAGYTSSIQGLKRYLKRGQGVLF